MEFMLFKNLVVFFFFFSILGCESSTESTADEDEVEADINDTSKRNDSWCFYIDAKTGLSKWIEVGDVMDVPDGRFTLFYSNGNEFKKGKIESNAFFDTVSFYKPEGGLNYRRIYSNDTILELRTDGICNEYFQNGRIKAQVNYKNNLRNGLAKSFHPNGAVQHVYTCENGLEHGKFIWLDINGDTNRISHWINGTCQGENIEFHDGLKYIGNVLNGEFHGKNTGFFPNGTIESIQYYKNGIQDSSATFYHENGMKKHQSHFIMGVKDGPEHSWNKDGRLTFEGLVKNDLSVWWIQYDNYNKVIETFEAHLKTKED